MIIALSVFPPTIVPLLPSFVFTLYAGASYPFARVSSTLYETPSGMFVNSTSVSAFTLNFAVCPSSLPVIVTFPREVSLVDPAIVLLNFVPAFGVGFVVSKKRR